MLSDFTILGTRVAVRLTEKKKQSDGGIVLPEQSVDMPNTGVVVLKGDGLKSTTLLIGREVVWSQFATVLGPVVIEGQSLWFVDESDILIAGK